MKLQKRFIHWGQGLAKESYFINEKQRAAGPQWRRRDLKRTSWKKGSYTNAYQNYLKCYNNTLPLLLWTIDSGSQEAIPEVHIPPPYLPSPTLSLLHIPD